MAKQGRGKDPEMVARRKLADAQAKLQSAQERRSRVATSGEQDVELARKRAADQLAKATKEVERRAGRVARAEAKLISLQSRTTDRSDSGKSPANSPQTVADHLEDIQSELVEQVVSQPLVLPNGVVDETAVAALEPLDKYAQRVLAALHDGFAQNGATFTDWMAAAGLAKRTFLRARKTLVDSGLVRREGEGRGALYFPVPESSV